MVAYELDAEDVPVGVPYHAVRIFREPLENAKSGGVGQPLNTARRERRSARRQLWRRKARLAHVLHLWRNAGLPVETTTAGHGVVALRAKAASAPIPLPLLPAVLLKLAKRRGYAGSFRVRGEREDAGQVQPGIERLHAEMQASGCATLGAYLHHRHQSGLTLKLKQAGLYADRALVQQEFDQIWRTQLAHAPELATQVADKPLRDALAEVLLGQRPLRSPRAMVGRCALEPNLPRAPAAQPAVQAFRIEKTLADLRWGGVRSGSPLTPQQRGVIRELLHSQKEVTFSALHKRLAAAGYPGPVGVRLNLERGGREALSGDSTRATLRTLKLLDKWDALSEVTQERVINFLAELGSPETVDQPGWETRVRGASDRPNRPRPVTLDPLMVAFINSMVATGRFGRLGAMGFASGRAAYSLKALKRLTACMRDEGCDEAGAVLRCYPTGSLPRRLATEAVPPPPETGSIVVDVALRQVHREVRRAIETLGGPPRQVIVELARDMALGIEKRNELTWRMRQNERARRKAMDELRAHGVDPTPPKIRRYLLWQEQGKGSCPYCDRTIGFADAMSGDATNFEHIRPQSLTQVRRRRADLVLAHAACNHAKGNRTPWQAFNTEPDRWRIVEARAEQFKERARNKELDPQSRANLRHKAKLLVERDFEPEVLDQAAIDEFADRQLHATSWIAKAVRQWLEGLCPDTYAARGELTANLRRAWGLETVIPQVRFDEGLSVPDELGQSISRDDFDRYRPFWEGHRAPGEERYPDKRADHRHHLIDALVIGLCTRSVYQRMAENRKAQMESGQRGFSLTIPPPLDNLRDLAVALVRNCNLSHKTDRWPGGALFKDTAYGVLERIETSTGTVDRTLAVRKKLSDLAPAKASADAVRKALKGIASEEVRGLVEAAFETRLLAGRSPQAALAEPVWYPAYGTHICRVRVLAGDAGLATAIHHGVDKRHVKHLIPEGYAYMEVGPGTAGRPFVCLVPQAEALRSGRQLPQGFIRFCKGDTVVDQRDGLRFVIRQIKTEGGGALCMVHHVETRGYDDLKGIGGIRKVSGKALLNLRPWRESWPNTAS
uniref:CRISPR-associated protein, Csn1 family n=1 Tax=uncultured bacterium UPO47 TaxID=1776972 RepID=A0A126SY73_9BACT|nr:CRISPR-associated protein, Csn1 family [uncultured bacterium UPO47]